MPVYFRDGNNNLQSAVSFTDLAGSNFTSTTGDSTAQTYRASMFYTLGVATPTAIVVMQGSGTKTVRVRSIRMFTATTSAGVMKFKLSRRSSGGTLGSAVLTAVPTQGKNDTASAAATMTISTVGTANYTTLGTLVSIMGSVPLLFSATTQQSGGTNFIPDGQAFVLRGASDYFTIDGGADSGGDAVPTGGIFGFTVEWIEDNS